MATGGFNELQGGTLTIGGRSYQVPAMDDLTLDEAELLERATFGSGERASRTGAIRGLVEIVKRRAGEKFDPDAIKMLRMGDLDFKEAEAGDADPPTSEAGDSASEIPGA